MENNSITIESPTGIRATCTNVEQAGALFRLLESQVPRSPEATSVADEPARRKRRARRAAPEESNGHANGKNKGGRQPSELTLAVYAAVEKDGNPDVKKLADKHGVNEQSVRTVLYRGVGAGKLKKLADGSYKVVGG